MTLSTSQLNIKPKKNICFHWLHKLLFNTSGSRKLTAGGHAIITTTYCFLSHSPKW